MMVDDIALTLEEGINPAACAHLLEVFGTAGAIYRASAEELAGRAELRADLAYRITRKQQHKRAEQEIAFLAKNEITAVASTSPRYPALLRECNDYPHVLYLKGDPDVLAAPMLAMVGTRKPNTYGLAACNRLVEGLARSMPGLVIVSGLAYGIDVACHRAALAHGLRTLGVLAGPLTTIYPSVHRGVAEDMVRRGGGIVTELTSGESPNRIRFLQRNRIIAGMAPGTVVMQSPSTGGSMVTASLADGYNRLVMAPPANIGEETSEGTNLLIRSMKARMVCRAEDILEELGWQAACGTGPERSAVALEGPQEILYELLCDRGRMPLEEIGVALRRPLPELIGMLMELEFEGYVRALPGNYYEKF